MSAIIHCRAVEKIYRQGAVEVRAVRGVDLSIEAGDFATLAGPSGSGKTTLLSLIGGLDRPTAGEIAVDGEPIAAMAKDRLFFARAARVHPRYHTPVASLVIQGTADTGVFPSDARRVFDAIGSADKSLEMIPGEHYFEDSAQHRHQAADVVCDWIKART